MKFYARCLDGEVSLMPYSEAPGDLPKGAKDKIMHARITKNGSTVLMASDALAGHGAPLHPGNNFSISLDCESLAEIEKLFTAFGENGKVTMPLQDTFWAPGSAWSPINSASTGCSTSKSPDRKRRKAVTDRRHIQETQSGRGGL